MQYFAYGHPFLECNGRTMMLVHFELANRAGFSINWQKTNKIDYLTALTRDIKTPDKNILNQYLLQFKEPKLEREQWLEVISPLFKT